MLKQGETKYCPRCRKVKPLAMFGPHKRYKDGLNIWCRECCNTYVKEYNKRPENRERLKECQRQSYQQHKESRKQSQKQYRQRLKLEILSHYSMTNYPMCARCGITNINFLCIDHTESGGTRQMRQLGKRGYGFYRWLKQASFPTGYQVLCANCNLEKRIIGEEN